MKYCTSCGEANPDHIMSCQGCGEKFTAASTVNPPPARPYYYTLPGENTGDGAATGSLVCGILSLFLFGLVLGIIAVVLSNSARRNGYQGGKATAGLVLGIIGLVGWGFIFLIRLIMLT